jgi:hypothetical protein
MLTAYTSGEAWLTHVEADEDDAASSAFSATPLAYDRVGLDETMTKKPPARTSSFKRARGGGCQWQ